MRRLVRTVVALLALGVAAAWWLTRPLTIAADELPEHTPDAAAGERIFWAGGCASCHASPVDGKRASGEDLLRLGGGMELDTSFGVFRVPNISPDRADGIGAWSMLDFVNAVQRGVSPDGRHLYPAFPYTSYAKMATRDVMDLRAYLGTLAAVQGRVEPGTLHFPWSLRRGIGLWKRLYLKTEPVVHFDSPAEAVLRGQALVEGAGHCGECHTPRDRFGGLILDRWLSGAPNLEGEGRVPNITPGGKEVSHWSAADIAYYLESGFTPDFDTVGGSMVAVQEELAHLGDEDRAAIAAYLKAIPAVD
jgi:mono/diheme cytochrome c family protein